MGILFCIGVRPFDESSILNSKMKNSLFLLALLVLSSCGADVHSNRHAQEFFDHFEELLHSTGSLDDVQCLEVFLDSAVHRSHFTSYEAIIDSCLGSTYQVRHAVVGIDMRPLRSIQLPAGVKRTEESRVRASRLYGLDGHRLTGPVCHVVRGSEMVETEDYVLMDFWVKQHGIEAGVHYMLIQSKSGNGQIHSLVRSFTGDKG